MKLNVKMIKCFQAVEFGGNNAYAFTIATPSGPTEITYDSETQFFCLSKTGAKNRHVPRENVPYCEFEEVKGVELDKPKRGRPTGNREGTETAA